MSERRSWRVLEVAKRGALPMAGLGLILLPFGVLLSFFLVGLPIASYAMAKIIERALDDARAVHSVTPRGSATVAKSTGCVVFLGVAGLALVGAIGGGVFAHEFVPDHSSLVAVLASAGLGGFVFAALSPLAFAPFANAFQGSRTLQSFSAAAQRASSIDTRRLAFGGALGGATLSAGIVLARVVAAQFPIDWPLVYAGAALLSALPIVASVVVFASAYAAAEAQSSDDAPAAARRVSRWIWMLAPAALMALAALGLASVTPSPMARVRGPSHQRGISHAFAPSVRLPGTSVRARGVLGGVEIVADDGGGAGRIEMPMCDEDARPLVAVRAEGDDFLVLAQGSDGYGKTHVSRDGVRLDDGLVQRVRSRGGFGVHLLALGMLALLFIAWRLGVEAGELKTLDAAALLEPGAASDAGRVAVTGRLRLAEGAKTYYRNPSRLLRLLGIARGGAHLRIEGEAWLEALGGETRIRLPDSKIPVFPGPADSSWDGETLTILSRFANLAPTGLRESSSAFPDDGRLVLGTPEYATQALSSHIAMAVAPATVLGVFTLVGGSLVFFFQ